MSQDAEGFDAYVCHPQFGNGMVRGQFVLSSRELRFESEETTFSLPLGATRIQIDKKDEDWVTLTDERQPDLQFQVASRILWEDRFVKHNHIHPQLQAQLGGREMRRRLFITFLFFAGFIFIVWLLANAANWMVPLIAKHIPAKTEVAYGDKLFAEHKDELHLLDDTNAVAQLNALAQPLVQTLPANGIPIRFYIVSGLPNAFALPGGRIMVTTGLLGMVETPEQLLGVLAHESAHVIQHHTDQQTISDQGPFFVLRILTSGNNGLLGSLAVPSAILIHDSFSQRYEKEADAYGWNYLVAAGINPHGMIEAFQKLRSQNPGGANLLKGFSDHPDLDQRIAWLNEKWDRLTNHENFITLTNSLPKLQ